MKKFLLSFAFLTLALVGVGCGDDEPIEEAPEDRPVLNVSEYDTESGSEDEETDAEEDADSEDDASDEGAADTQDEDETDTDEEAEEPVVDGDTLSASNFSLTVPQDVTIAQLRDSDKNEYFITACEDPDCFVSADAEDDDYTLYVVTGNEADLKKGEQFTDIYKTTSPDEVAGQSVTFGTDAEHPDGPGPNYAYYKSDEKTGEFVWIEVSYVEGTGLEAAKETLENIDWK